MNLNKFNPPYLLWKEDFVSNTFFSTIGEYFGVRTLQGKNNKGLKFLFNAAEPLTSNDLVRFSLNFNLFTVVEQTLSGVIYQCRIDTRDGIYNFQVEIDYSDSVDPSTILLNGITSSTDAAEGILAPVQTDFTNPIFVSDNCYNAAVDTSPDSSTPIARNGAVEVVFSKDIFIHNRSGIQIYYGSTTDPGYAIVSNGSSMVPEVGDDVGTVINDDNNGVRVLDRGVTALDVGGTQPEAGDVVRSANYLIAVSPSVSGDTLTISPSTGTFKPGRYIVYLSSDSITDMAGNFFSGKTNMFIVA